MGKIHVLADDLKNRIAAGEVVERPASVVKELIENSIDAGADRVEVVVTGGGNASIRVVDNGEGLDEQDLVLAFDRYTTSKIEQTDDLQRISTLGFRGEALASIASVAKVTAVSSANAAESGHELVITDGRVSGPFPAATARGTSVTVSDLFFTVPARRKFLKSPRVELRHVIQTVRRFSLCYPSVAFQLTSDGKEILTLQPQTLEQRIGKVFDPTYPKNMLAVDYEKDMFKIGGYVGNLNLLRKRRGEQFLFLNGRYIADSLLNSAVFSAYQSLISRGEFPFFVLNLYVPLNQVDVNVHPMKIEVRFRDEWRIYHVLKSAVTESISDILRTIPDFVPSLSTKEEAAPRALGQGNVQFPDRVGTLPRSVRTESVERAKEYVKSFAERGGEQSVVDLDNIWQVHDKYIVSQIKSGLVIIDQHVAHERILFEQALAAMEGNSMASQALLFPQVVELPPDDFSMLLDLFQYLERIGFRMKEFGKNTVLVEGVPLEMGWGNEKQILKDIIDYYHSHHREYASFQEAVAASFACRAAVKAGDKLAKEEMQSLVDRLFATRHPYYCPHGRPIIINLTLQELDRRFERG